MRKMILVLAMALAACSNDPNSKPRPEMVTDQCLRAKLFQECLKVVPAGPVATRYNDWDEVVDSCETAAARQSYLPEIAVKPECARHY